MLFLVDWHIHVTYVPIIVSYCPLRIHVAMIAMIDMQYFFFRCCLQLHPNFSIKLSPTKTKVPSKKPPGAQAESMAWFGLLRLGNTTLPAVDFFGGTYFFFFVVGWGGKMHHNWNPSHLESS